MYVGRSVIVYASPVVDTSGAGWNPWSVYLERGRRAKGWTVQELADALGVGRSTIYDWRTNGGSEKIAIEVVLAAAKAFGDHPVNAFMAAVDLVEDEPHDEELGMILLHPHLTDEEKQREIQRLEARRERDKQNRIADTQEFLRDLGRRAS